MWHKITDTADPNDWYDPHAPTVNPVFGALTEGFIIEENNGGIQVIVRKPMILRQFDLYIQGESNVRFEIYQYIDDSTTQGVYGTDIKASYGANRVVLKDLVFLNPGRYAFFLYSEAKLRVADIGRETSATNHFFSITGSFFNGPPSFSYEPQIPCFFGFYNIEMTLLKSDLYLGVFTSMPKINDLIDECHFFYLDGNKPYSCFIKNGIIYTMPH